MRPGRSPERRSYDLVLPGERDAIAPRTFSMPPIENASLQTSRKPVGLRNVNCCPLVNCDAYRAFSARVPLLACTVHSPPRPSRIRNSRDSLARSFCRRNAVTSAPTAPCSIDQLTMSQWSLANVPLSRVAQSEGRSLTQRVCGMRTRPPNGKAGCVRNTPLPLSASLMSALSHAACSVSAATTMPTIGTLSPPAVKRSLMALGSEIAARSCFVSVSSSSIFSSVPFHHDRMTPPLVSTFGQHLRRSMTKSSGATRQRIMPRSRYGHDGSGV